MSGWRPIATAPRDGTPVDIWGVHGCRRADAEWSVNDEWWVTSDGEYISDSGVTHWMPIPDGPTQGD